MVDKTDTDSHLYEIVASDLKQKILDNYFGEEGKIPKNIFFPAIILLPQRIPSIPIPQTLFYVHGTYTCLET